MIEPRTESGIEIAMMRVERQLPRNSRIIRLVSAAAMTPSRTTPATARLHEDAIDRPAAAMFIAAGNAGLDRGRLAA